MGEKRETSKCQKCVRRNRGISAWFVDSFESWTDNGEESDFSGEDDGVED